MRKQILVDDAEKLVVAVWVNDSFMYTRTYIKDDEGYCKKEITVFYDGSVDIQNYEEITQWTNLEED